MDYWNNLEDKGLISWEECGKNVLLAMNAGLVDFAGSGLEICVIVVTETLLTQL